MKKTLMLTAVLFLVGCTKDDDTKRILTDQGFTEVQTTGYRPFA